MSFTDFPKSLTEIGPLEEILPELGFIEREGGYIRYWNNVRVFVGHGMWGDTWGIIRDGHM